MNERAIEQQVLQYLHVLAKSEQLKALNYLKSLAVKQKSPNERLLKLAGSIAPEELDQMEQAIAQGCEQIDQDER